MELNRTQVVIAVIGAVLIAVKCANTESRPPIVKTPAQLAYEAKQDAEFQFAVLGAKSVKARLKNPASFELVDAGIVDSGVLCVTYRSTNSFNAVVTEQIAVRRDLSISKWDNVCGNHSAVDMSHIRHAM